MLGCVNDKLQRFPLPRHTRWKSISPDTYLGTLDCTKTGKEFDI